MPHDPPIAAPPAAALGPLSLATYLRRDSDVTARLTW
jgi:hypothetical protein